jgi:hypothetical protein
MFFTANLNDFRRNDQIGIKFLSLKDVMQGDEEEFNYEPARILKQTSEEIYFEIDHALPLSSNISIKITKQSPELKTMDDVWTVHRGRVQSCVKIENSHGTRYEVCFQIIDTVLQREVVKSRLSPN